MNNQPVVKIVSSSDNGLRLCAAAARISTTEGKALGIFSAREGGEKDSKLVSKVLSSGHQSLIEHEVVSVALDNVSVLVEQCLIEFRLSSFTVKSRRYVDFEQAGFYLAESLDAGSGPVYESAVRDRFRDYASLTQLGVPLEDARFVLPYCFFSSLYMTTNARELTHMIGSMLYGRHSRFAELRHVGALLKDEFERVFPGVMQLNRARYEQTAVEILKTDVGMPVSCEGSATLVGAPDRPGELLDAALAFHSRLACGEYASLVRDARPRELEVLSYTFLLRDVSLACVTHIARHRIQSPMFEPTGRALAKNRYVLPETIRQNAQAKAIYENAFMENAKNAASLSQMGLSVSDMAYLALSGDTVDVMLSMNARELMHFFKLRTCERAQWEIRHLSEQMLTLLRASFPALFRHYGPSCLVEGRCPEGKLSCGRPRTPPV